MPSKKPAPAVNTRHDLNPFLVMAQIDHAISRHRERIMQIKAENEQTHVRYQEAIANGTPPCTSKPPISSSAFDSMLNRQCEKEREVYSRVRVIELPVKGKRFILVYGDADDAKATVNSATGRFSTFQNAADFFLNGGR